MSSTPRFGLKTLTVLYAVMAMSSALRADVAWGKALQQAPAWYSSDEAAKLADNLLAYQHSSGGWPKNTDMSLPPSAEFLAKHEKSVGTDHGPTIDNEATTTQLNFLAKIISERPEKRWLESFNRGFDYLLKAQYPNGGWPQFFPLRGNYSDHITFNDNATSNVMRVLRGAITQDTAFKFVDETRRKQAALAYQKAIDCILKCQAIVGGKKTIWGAQHDEKTFALAAARKFEPVSLCSKESVGLIDILMDVEKPSPSIIEAVESAIAWLDKNKITGVRVDKVPMPDKPGSTDKVVVADPNAKPLWARFYEVPSFRPIFIGRDAIPRYSLAEIEHERRVGYGWYATEPNSLLDSRYPKWKKRLSH